MESGRTTELAAALPSTATADDPPGAYARKATGMVREVSAVDMVAFNAASAGGGGIALVIGLYYVFGSFPGANLYLTLVIALLAAPFVWLAFSLLSSVFPRAGGDYVIGSRVLHPVVGLASNLGVLASTVLAAGLWGVFLTAVGLAPAFTIIGITTGNSWWTNAAATISEKGWTFGIATAFIVAMSLLAVARTRLIARVSTLFFAIGYAGLIVSLLILLFKSRTGFEARLNEVSQPFTHSADTYHDTIDAGRKAGIHYPAEAGYSVRNTIGSLYATLAVMLLFWWGTYMAGEMKQGGRRRRQLATIMGTGFGQSLLILFATVIFVKTIGYEFFAAANAGSYGVPVSPWYTYFAAIVADSNIVSVVLALSFVGFLVPGMFINLVMCQRALFAWSFDGLLPRSFSSVNERTHTPIVAIVVVCVGAIGCAYWSTYANIATILTITAALLALPMVVVGLSALLLPSRRPELFAGSPADWTWRGLPMLKVAGAGCVVVALVWFAILCWFHTAIGVTNAWIMPAMIPLALALAFVHYRIAGALQARRGNRLEYVYKTIPPE